jgi:hypothetical protein
MTRTRFAALLAAAVMLVAAGGCQMHYRVTDTTTGKRYYTTTKQTNQASGVISFVDGKTGRRITIHQTYRVEDVTPESYQSAIGIDPEQLAIITSTEDD